MRGAFRKGSEEATLELYMNDLNEEKEPSLRRSVLGTGPEIFSTLSLILPAILQSGE